jgi:hypothetical protein
MTKPREDLAPQGPNRVEAPGIETGNGDPRKLSRYVALASNHRKPLGKPLPFNSA